jgi:hypothetical protein
MNESMTDVATTTFVACERPVDAGRSTDEDGTFQRRKRPGEKRLKSPLKLTHAMFQPVRRLRWTRACAAAIALGAAACGDGSKLVLNQQAEAHRVSSDLRVQFTRAADASNRAVMTDTDEASTAAAHEAAQATQAVLRDIDTLRPILENLGDTAELAQLDSFKTRFDEYASSTTPSCRWRSRTPTSRRSGCRSARRRTRSPRSGRRSRPRRNRPPRRTAPPPTRWRPGRSPQRWRFR